MCSCGEYGLLGQADPLYMQLEEGLAGGGLEAGLAASLATRSTPHPAKEREKVGFNQ